MSGDEIGGVVVGLTAMVALGAPIFLWSQKIHPYPTWIMAILSFVPVVNILFWFPFTAATEVGWSESGKALAVFAMAFCSLPGWLIVIALWLYRKNFVDRTRSAQE